MRYSRSAVVGTHKLRSKKHSFETLHCPACSKKAASGSERREFRAVFLEACGCDRFLRTGSPPSSARSLYIPQSRQKSCHAKPLCNHTCLNATRFMCAEAMLNCDGQLAQSASASKERAKLWHFFLELASKLLYCAYASCFTENKGLLTESTLLLSKESWLRQQASGPSCANALVLCLLLH